MEQEASNRLCAEDEIRRLNEDLERRIAERTAELEAVNKELQKEITDRRRAEEKFEFAMELTPNAWVMVDQEGRIVMVNSQTEKLFGYRRDELLGTELDILVPNRFRDVHQEYRAGSFAHPSARPMGAGRDLYALRKDGSEFPVEIRLNPIETDQGTFVLSAIVDISERKRWSDEERKKLEAQVLHAQKLESLGVLAGGIAHDFNNLLLSVLGNAGLALDELPPESPARSIIQDIEVAALRMAELTKQMLAYSGRGKFVIQPISLSSLVKEMVHLLKISISKKATFRMRLADNLPIVEGDAAQMQQVVMNLITNASEALGDKAGDVIVSTGTVDADRAYLSESFMDESLPAGRYVYLEVTDTGCGMDKETQSRIFDPFFTTKFTGRGLGLAAVLGIVRGHKGAIRVYSEPGRGTVVKVLFPVSEQPVLAIEQSMETRTWRCSGTILIVDDEEDVRTVARRVLEKIGFTVITARDGRSGLEIFRAHADKIQLVLLDLTLPDLSGEEIFQAIRTIRPDVKVILSSGYNEQEVIGLFQSRGLAGFLQKPYQPKKLQEKVREILLQKPRQQGATASRIS